jgi:hypothetical protein
MTDPRSGVARVKPYVCAVRQIIAVKPPWDEKRMPLRAHEPKPEQFSKWLFKVCRLRMQALGKVGEPVAENITIKLATPISAEHDSADQREQGASPPRGFAPHPTVAFHKRYPSLVEPR